MVNPLWLCMLASSGERYGFAHGGVSPYYNSQSCSMHDRLRQVRASTAGDIIIILITIFFLLEDVGI